MNVAGEVFDEVSHGFHKSLSLLKDPDMTRVESTVSFRETLRDFNHIMEMARNSCKLPVINIDEMA